MSMRKLTALIGGVSGADRPGVTDHAHVRRTNLRDAMTINHLFLAFMGLVGAAVGIILVLKPETRDYRISPYFWVLLAMALFELLAFARGRGAPGTAVTMDVRVSGFLMAIVLMVVIPIVAGSSVRLF
jgi:hypothetical protein